MKQKDIATLLLKRGNKFMLISFSSREKSQRSSILERNQIYQFQINRKKSVFAAPKVPWPAWRIFQFHHGTISTDFYGSLSDLEFDVVKQEIRYASKEIWSCRFNLVNIGVEFCFPWRLAEENCIVTFKGVRKIDLQVRCSELSTCILQINVWFWKLDCFVLCQKSDQVMHVGYCDVRN